MDIAKKRLEGLIKHMRIVILKLLGSLDREQIVHPLGKTVNVILIVAIQPVA